MLLSSMSKILRSEGPRVRRSIFDDGVVSGVVLLLLFIVVGVLFKNWRGNFLWEFCEKLRKSWVPLHS